MRSDMAISRSLTEEQIDNVANEMPMLQSTEYLLAANLVDTSFMKLR